MSGALRRLRRRARRRLRRLRHSGAQRSRVLIGCAGLLAVGAIWILITGLLARQQEQRLESRLRAAESLLAAGQLPAAESVARDIPALARRAHLLTTGPAWWLAAEVPFFGEPVHVVRASFAASDRLGTQGVPQLLRVAALLDPTKLRLAGNRIATEPLIQAAPQLASAAAAIDGASRGIDALPNHTWLAMVNGPRLRLQAQLDAVRGYVDAAANAARVLPAMLGTDGPKRYFIGLQNEAEMRGTGGLPGAFAIAVADHGKITFTHFESDDALLPLQTGQHVQTGLDFGPGYDAAYGSATPTSFIVNSDISPNFPYAAQIWARMWEKVSGEHVDGAIAVDPYTLASFLAVTGPVTLPSGTAVTADNIVPLTERDEYSLFDDNEARKAFLVSVLKSASEVLISGRGAATDIARVVSATSQEQRMLVWSSDPATESVLAATSYGGALPPASRPLSAVVLNNIAAGKLDYYLTRTIDYHRSGCASRRDVLVTVDLTNDAPASGLPPYVDTRLDNPPFPVQPGDNRTQLDYYATGGAQLLSASLNGKPTTAAVLTDLGHPIFRIDVELPRGTTQELTLHLTEPAGSGDPVIWHQPGVTPLQVNAYSQPCS